MIVSEGICQFAEYEEIVSVRTDFYCANRRGFYRFIGGLNLIMQV
jgi:hypothetical protein